MSSDKLGIVVKYSDSPVVITAQHSHSVVLYNLESESDCEVSCDEFMNNSQEFNIDEALKKIDPYKYASYRRTYLSLMKNIRKAA